MPFTKTKHIANNSCSGCSCGSHRVTSCDENGIGKDTVVERNHSMPEPKDFDLGTMLKAGVPLNNEITAKTINVTKTTEPIKKDNE